MPTNERAVSFPAGIREKSLALLSYRRVDVMGVSKSNKECTVPTVAVVTGATGGIGALRVRVG